jgi:RNA polymerase sigma factor (sigma-70 family)
VPAGAASEEGVRGKERDAAEDARLVELRALVSRVVAARVQDPDTVADLVQETLARVLKARDRLDDEAWAPYAVVTARNLVHELGRAEERHQRHAHRLAESTTAPSPEEAVVRREEDEALNLAFSRLPPADRRALASQVTEDAEVSVLAEESGSTPGAVAVRLSRARARLRVEYVLALRRVELPTPRCKSVLLALSSGDRRRQEALEAGEHLLRCECCAELSAPLLKRSRSLAVLWPVVAIGGFLKRLGHWARAHPVYTSGATAGVAAVTVAVVLLARPDAGFLRSGPTSLLPPPPPQELATKAGQPVEARSVQVQSVVSPTRFWVGSNRRERLFVEVLAPPTFPVRAGERVSFVGHLDANHEGSVERFGLQGVDAAQLNQQGHHIHVEAHDLRTG